jgi:uncharacterized protein
MSRRRDFLQFMAAFAGSAVLTSHDRVVWSATPSVPSPRDGLSFRPLKAPIPLPTDNRRLEEFANYEIRDDLVLPEGFVYEVIAAWGDRVGDSRFGYNNDYLSFVQTGRDAGYLTVNFEYVSPLAWMQAFEGVIGNKLPFDMAIQGVKEAGNGGIDVSQLPAGNLLKQAIGSICWEAMVDRGLGIITLRRNSSGMWQRSPSSADRRVTGISGLRDDRYLRCTGPARNIFTKRSGRGYIDSLGERIIGTFGNCSGGTTPWGTVLSAEENFQNDVAEAVYEDGTVFSPSSVKFNIDRDSLEGQGNIFGLAGNKYGWIVEIDPSNPRDYGTKHTYLGRYRHEAVGIRVEAGKQLAFYSGCDRPSGHIYKFVSEAVVRNPQSKSNSKLLEKGTLYAAKFNADGTGTWIPLIAETPVNPESPSTIVGNTLYLPKRPDGGFFTVSNDTEINTYKQQFKTLNDLYSGTPIEKQGAILIDAHYAANACGATCTARPEDTDIAPDGSLYIAFTSGSSRPADGGCDKRIFKGSNGEIPHEYGFIMRLTEDNNRPNALTFKWNMLALGGDPELGGAGFSNPDNLMLDNRGNVWMTTDISSSSMNKTNNNGIDRRGIFGNNNMWFLPTRGRNAGNAYLFATGPMDAELTGPFLTRDRATLFLSIQHPGEINGMRVDRQSESRQITISTKNGTSFQQTRTVPIGSNFPTKQPNAFPKPAVVAIRNTKGTI